MAAAIGAGAATGAVATAAVTLGLLATQYPQFVSLGQGTLIAAGLAGLAGAAYGATRTPDLTPETRPKFLVKCGFNETSSPTAAGERTKNGLMGLAVGAGVATAAIALTQVAGHLNPMGWVAPTVLGGFIGAVGTLAGDRRSSISDSVTGGMLAGGAAAIFSGNPAMVVAGAVASGVGGRAVKPAGKVVLGALAGAATGALAGFMSGQDLVNSALIGAATGPVGALIGPPMRQLSRNATVDLTKAALAKTDPWIAAHPLSKAQKVVLGGVAGALVLGPMGMVAGWNGALIAGSVGIAAGSIKAYTFLNEQERLKEAAGAKVAAEVQQSSVASYILRPSAGAHHEGGLTNLAGSQPIIPRLVVPQVLAPQVGLQPQPAELTAK